jgi:deazaflavin-dependent oxidoreductase (nitroreductase family)
VLTRRLGNAIVKALVATPLAPPNYALLTVTGRKSGKPYSTPVRPIKHEGQRFLVAPYGAVAWVRNARAAGQVTLTRNGHRETVAVVECTRDQSAPVLREYVRAVPATRPYFDARPEDPLDRFTAEAAQHPVLRIID